jgi:hypothetical protein
MNTQRLKEINLILTGNAEGSGLYAMCDHVALSAGVLCDTQEQAEALIRTTTGMMLETLRKNYPAILALKQGEV